MRVFWNTTFLVIGVIPLAVCPGCGESYPECIEVRGVVTYQGKPVKDGWISFVPSDSVGSEGQLVRPASGDLQSDGSYALKTFREGDGVLPGKYSVTVAAFDSSGAMAPGSDPRYRRLQSTIPEKYGSPTTSGLTATIPPNASGGLQFDFDLKD